MNNMITSGGITYEAVTMFTDDGEAQELLKVTQDGNVFYIYDPTEEDVRHRPTFEFWIWDEDSAQLYFNKEDAKLAEKHGGKDGLMTDITTKVGQMDIQALIKLKEILEGDSKS